MDSTHDTSKMKYCAGEIYLGVQPFAPTHKKTGDNHKVSFTAAFMI